MARTACWAVSHSRRPDSTTVIEVTADECMVQGNSSVSAAPVLDSVELGSSHSHSFGNLLDLCTPCQILVDEYIKVAYGQRWWHHSTHFHLLFSTNEIRVEPPQGCVITPDLSELLQQQVVTLSNALFRSRRATAVKWLLSTDFFHSSVTFSSNVSQECPARIPDCF